MPDVSLGDSAIVQLKVKPSLRHRIHLQKTRRMYSENIGVTITIENYLFMLSRIYSHSYSVVPAQQKITILTKPANDNI